MGLRRKEKSCIEENECGSEEESLLLLRGLFLLCAVFIVGIFYSSVYRLCTHGWTKIQIEQNVFVQGIDVSGLTNEAGDCTD